MEKINYGRMILGGVLAGVVIWLTGFIFHGVLLAEKYKFYANVGSVLAEPRPMGFPFYIVGIIISGLALSMMYVVGRKFGGPGPMTAIRVGLTVALFTTAGMAAEYTFYNLGGMVPLLSFANNIVGAVLGTLVAGGIYKD